MFTQRFSENLISVRTFFSLRLGSFLHFQVRDVQLFAADALSRKLTALRAPWIMVPHTVSFSHLGHRCPRGVDSPAGWSAQTGIFYQALEAELQGINVDLLQFANLHAHFRDANAKIATRRQLHGLQYRGCDSQFVDG